MGWHIFGAIVGLVINLIICFKFAEIAAEKGYSKAYFWLGFFFGAIGFAWIAALPDAHLWHRVSELERKLNTSSNPYANTSVVSSSAATSNFEHTPTIVKSTVTEDGNWICGKCETLNQAKYGQCKKCGSYRG